MAAVLSLAAASGCRAPADAGMLRPELWGAGWHGGMGTSSSGVSYQLHRRPRAGGEARTYFLFVDRRCRLVPGTIELDPWHPRGSNSARARGHTEPTRALEISRWQVHDVGGFAVVPVGTWMVRARHSIQQSPLAAARLREWDAEYVIELDLRADEDAAIVLQRVVPTRTDRHVRLNSRRMMHRELRASRRCFAGSEQTPRFEVDPEWVARCATTTAQDRAQATSCDAL